MAKKRPITGWNVALAIGGGMLFVLLAMGGFGYYFWTQHYKPGVQAGLNSWPEGEAFGKSSDNSGCVQEAVARYRKDKTFTNGVASTVFLQACLPVSQAQLDFCEKVPPAKEILATMHWTIAQCAKAELGIQDDHCMNLFSAVQDFCHKSKFNKH